MGYAAIIICYIHWGLVPIYWKLLQGIEPVELMMYRLVFSSLIAFALMVLRKKWRDFATGFQSWRSTGFIGISALAVGINWFTFMWMVVNDRVAESSLGYFLCPFVSISLGFIFEKERPSFLQWVAVAFAGVGVSIMGMRMGYLPFPALVIAVSWGFYSLLKKRSALGPMTSLAGESVFMLPVAVGYLWWLGARSSLEWSGEDIGFRSLVASTGVVTVLPLFIYSFAAKKLTLTAIGLFQYLTPTISLLLAVFHFGEPFGMNEALVFGFIWLGLALYIGEKLRAFWFGNKAVTQTA
ncbi:MAG: EamA family transporter RarD [Verrucomicrobiota bacterium]